MKLLGHTFFVCCFIVVIFTSCNSVKKEYPYSSIDKETYVYKTYEDVVLELDLYQPLDLNEKLPLIIYVHGGGFIRGHRDEKGIIAFAKTVGQHGYAVASISYRLSLKNQGRSCNIKASKKIEAFNIVSEDLSNAVSFILTKAKNLNIDESKIVLAGASAGAEGLLNLVYGSEQYALPKGFKFAGIISTAGSVITLDYITKETAIPSLFFHGTNDKTVPYDIGSHRSCKLEDAGYLTLYGSKAIATKLKLLHKPYHLVAVKNGSHSLKELSLSDILSISIDFLDNEVITSKKRQIDDIL